MSDLKIEDGHIDLAGAWPKSFVSRLFPDSDTLPLTCPRQCPVRVGGSVGNQGKFHPGGGRELTIDIAAGGRRRKVALRSRW